MQILADAPHALAGRGKCPLSLLTIALSLPVPFLHLPSIVLSIPHACAVAIGLVQVDVTSAPPIHWLWACSFSHYPGWILTGGDCCLLGVWLTKVGCFAIQSTGLPTITVAVFWADIHLSLALFLGCCYKTPIPDSSMPVSKLSLVFPMSI